jgi:hypothetical protein
MKNKLETAHNNIDLYKCFDTFGRKYTTEDLSKSIEVIIPGNLYIIDHFLTCDECDSIIKLAANVGFKVATETLVVIWVR